MYSHCALLGQGPRCPSHRAAGSLANQAQACTGGQTWQDGLVTRPLSNTLTEKAYRAIRAKLGRGDLRPGDRLVNRTLATEIGISFTPVREAINQLASEGLIEYIRGAGAYVRRIDRKELEQLFDLRDTLEPFAAKRAALHIKSENLVEAHRLCDKFHALALDIRHSPGHTATSDQWHRWIELEEAFHGLVLEAADNVWLRRIAGELQLMALLFGPQRAGHGILTLSTAAKNWREHLLLVQHLERGDAAKAESRMRMHIAAGRERLLAWHDLQVREEAKRMAKL